MDFTIKLKKIKTVEQIEGYWTNEDYINLLELLDYPDASSIPASEIVDMLSMAISDFEPAEAAEIVLKYKLSDHLNEGQIENISNEMLLDKIAEEYSDISLHYPLYNINQLLFKAYNGKFPNTLASVIDLEITTKKPLSINKEVLLRMLSDLLTERSLLKRLFNEQLDSEKELKDANSIVWELKPMGENNYQIISSDYWFSKEDFATDEISGTLSEEEITHDY
jgi:phosphopantothenoylcysteine synthetase/decarboxylase